MRVFTILAVLFLLIFGVFYYLTVWSYSDGERAGTVSTFSRRGYVFKTYEGVLNVGGFSGETGSLTPQYFSFSVKDDSVAAKLNEAIRTGKRVTLHYEEKLVRLPWNGETKYFVTEVELLDDPYGYGFPGQRYQQPKPQAEPNQTEPTNVPEPAPLDTVNSL